MSNNETYDWLGQSGAFHRYWILATPLIPSSIKSEGGNYVFARLLDTGNFVPLYFGKADDLRDRIPGHECWPPARNLGVTHVMAHTTPDGDAARSAEEQDLIGFWNPPLNKQHRTVG